MNDTFQELQLDGLPGPTHHFGGLSYGNIASMTHAGWRSSPRRAALQGLAKMRQLLELGLMQCVLPPLERPDMGFLRSLGFSGGGSVILRRAARDEPHLVRLAMSSSFMWAANAATVIPSVDARDGRCHVVVANLAAMPHRALESAARAEMLERLFRATDSIVIHPPLPGVSVLSDEGAANHSRLAKSHGSRGWHLFVHGRTRAPRAKTLPRRFPARQSREASRSVARLGHLPLERAFFIQQHPGAIDAGAFHNDVVMVGDCDRLLLHEQCWSNQKAVLRELRRRLPALTVYEVKERELSLGQTVRSYLFNSQLLHTQGGHVLLAPAEASRGASGRIARRLVDNGFVTRVIFQELDQSMAGGGGPACLRLRIPLSDEETSGVAKGITLTEEKIDILEAWVRRHYRDVLTPGDLLDTKLLEESREALDSLTQILDLGSIYPFQRGES